MVKSEKIVEDLVIVLAREELCDFLNKSMEKGPVLVNFQGHETVKHVIETIGIPHTEVGEIYVNHESVGFHQRLEVGDLIDVYPWYGKGGEIFHSIIRPDPPQLIRFVLDSHLGKLASYLRLMGIDTIYRNDFDDYELASISSKEDRYLLTRDQGLLKHSIITYGYWVREIQPRLQLMEIVSRFNIGQGTELLSRCANCNGLLNDVSKNEILHLLEHKTRLYYDKFRKCSGCGQIYWKGSHFLRIEDFLSNVLNGNISGKGD